MKMELNRRNFLTGSTAALGAAALPAWAKEEEKLNASADTVILCWMAGGMASTETFDPKRYTPFEKGLKSDQVLSTFRRSIRPWITSRSVRASNTWPR